MQISYCTETLWLAALAELENSFCFDAASLFIKMKKPGAAIPHEYMLLGSLLCARDESLLMYDYMSFGSLQSNLFG